VTFRPSPLRDLRTVTATRASSRASVTVRSSPLAAPTERHSNSSKQGRRYVPSVAYRDLRNVTATTPRVLNGSSPIPAASGRWQPPVAGDVQVVPRRGGRGEDSSSPRPAGCLLAGGKVVQFGRDARRSSANVRLPAAAQASTAQPFVLDRLPGTRPAAGHGRWRVRDAPSARAASLASSAALPVPARVPPWPRPSTPTLVGTLVPTPATRVPPRRLAAGSPLVMPPRGASRPQKPRPTSPPQGEWSGRAARCASRD
jgi:hypothetical protein